MIRLQQRRIRRGSKSIAVVLSLAAIAACKPAAKHSQGEVAAIVPEPQNSGQPSEVESDGENAIPKLEEHRFPLLVWAAFLVQTEYFDPSRFDLMAQVRGALDGLSAQVPEVFFAIKSENVDVTVGAAARTFHLPAAKKGFFAAVDVLEDILAFVSQTLALEEEEIHEAEYATISGLFSPLDPHTILLTPKEHAELGVRTRGRFGGVGAVIREDGRAIRIEDVLPEMPAAKAGLQKGDLLLAIDGRPTSDMSAQDAQERLRGPQGSVVRVKVSRGRKVLSLKITRAIIHFPAITFRALPDQVGIVELSTFQEDAAADLQREIEKNAEACKNGIILDLRNNAGGLLNEATAIVDLFVDRGELIAVHSASGREAQTATKGLVVAPELPLIVLINENSASASEIVSGGLQELGRAVIVGRTSFGKGSVQRVNDAEPYGRELALKMTVAEYRVANDRRIQTVGVTPDLSLIPVILGEVPGMALYYDELAFQESREAAQVAHLPSAKHERDIVDARASRALKLRYFDEVDEDGASAPMREPEVRLAQEIALSLGQKKALTREERATVLAAFRTRVAKIEEDRIVEALKRDAIDYTGVLDASQDIPIQIEIHALASLSANEDAQPKRKVKSPAPASNAEPFRADTIANVSAGGALNLEVRVTNRGDKVAQRVHLLTRSALDELDRQEILFGKLAPGESQTRKVVFEVDSRRPALREKVEILAHAGEPQEEADGQTTLQIEVDPLPRPSFAFDWWIVDSEKWSASSPARPKVVRYRGEEPFRVGGNSDGRLQPGEKVLLAMRVHNRSTARAKNAQIVLRNHSSAQGLIEEDHHSFGELAPGASRTISFGLTVAPDASPELPLELEVLAADALTHSGVAHTLRLPVFTQADPTFVFAAPGETVVLREPIALRAEASADAPLLGMLPAFVPATIVARYGEWTAFAGEDGQRMWANGVAGLSALAKGGRAKAGHWMTRARVEPPKLAFDVPLTADAASVQVHATATDDAAVRDVVIWVAGISPPEAEHKVAYRAQSESAQDPARLEFDATLPLRPGGNFIRAVARDADRVAVEATYWLLRQ
jgi:carboxyl-terminal processing protease